MGRTLPGHISIFQLSGFCRKVTLANPVHRPRTPCPSGDSPQSGVRCLRAAQKLQHVRSTNPRNKLSKPCKPFSPRCPPKQKPGPLTTKFAYTRVYTCLAALQKDPLHPLLGQDVSPGEAQRLWPDSDLAESEAWGGPEARAFGLLSAPTDCWP